MNSTLFILAFGWTFAMAATRIQLLTPGEEAWLFTAQAWRIALAAGLVIAEIAFIAWAFLQLSPQVAAMILIGGFGVGMLSIKSVSEAAINIAKPLMDAIAIGCAACLWLLFFPL